MNKSRYRSPNHNRHDGFGMNLYRNKKAAKLGGVCAGVADHFEINHNVMRLIFIAGVLFTGMLLIWLYFIAWIVLGARQEPSPKISYEYDENEGCYKKRNMFRYRRSAADRVKKANERLQKLSGRISNMERYVTSKRFNLDREFADLE